MSLFKDLAYERNKFIDHAIAVKERESRLYRYVLKDGKVDLADPKERGDVR